MERSHKHHYVPEWYQRRFMVDDTSSYFRLDLDPKIIKTPSGKIIRKGEVLNKGPKKFFYDIDLYTTEYFGIQNDDIEKYLFGKIDTLGNKALSALVSKNWMREIHPYYITFFEYMDAQRLRTPRGLVWLLMQLKSKNYNQLLIDMQSVRKMHCTMWAEAKLEIVNASTSNTKFIVSDNPVTLYNPSCYPKSKYCSYPRDPGIHFKGTRTIFPLDLNHCVILTNKEYARSPGKLKELKPRTNARLHDSTITRYDDMIRDRELAEIEVIKINYILKSRAHRYIAAGKEDWLYPENNISDTDWRKFNKILISNKFNHMGRDGQIFIGGANGKLIATQDEFGRKPTSAEEWKERELEMKKMKAHVEKLLKK